MTQQTASQSATTKPQTRRSKAAVTRRAATTRPVPAGQATTGQGSTGKPAKIVETDLYAPIKAHLESLGYEVKSEVRDCDVVAMREGEAPLVVELKTSFTLPLLFQAIERQALSDTVYVAVPAPKKGNGAGTWKRHRSDILKLCRMLGLGLMTVEPKARKRPKVEVHLDPAPYRPRKNARRQAMLMKEFQRRAGDPNQGGSTRRPIVTAYRQDALRCAIFLSANGPSKVALIRNGTEVAQAAPMLQRDVYGWFERAERGTYALTPAGSAALALYQDVVATLQAQINTP